MPAVQRDVVTTSVPTSASSGTIGNLVGGAQYACYVLADSVCSTASSPVTVNAIWVLPAGPVSVTGQSAYVPQIGVSSDGTKAVAVWQRYNGAKYIVQAATSTIANNVAT